jgi:hypothetical protein
MPGQSMHDTLHVGGASEALRDPNGIIYLILSHLIHRLSCDTNKQSITIQWFTRRIKYSMDPIGYKCLVCPSQQKGYSVGEATFRYPVSVSGHTITRAVPSSHGPPRKTQRGVQS